MEEIMSKQIQIDC